MNREPTQTLSMTDTIQHKILIVEDEAALAQGVRDALQYGNYQAQIATDGLQALEHIRAHKPDLIVLDLMLPGMGGLEILETMRKEGLRSRVLILTALADEDDILRGFQSGADDYLTKPFSPRELVARVDAQFRRVEMDAGPPETLNLPGDIQVDLARLEVHRDGKMEALTPREGDILKYLIRHRDRVVTRGDLLLDVWHYQSANVETRTVDIHIVGLRRKVEPDPANPSLIQTVRGKGYRWHDSA